MWRVSSCGPDDAHSIPTIPRMRKRDPATDLDILRRQHMFDRPTLETTTLLQLLKHDTGKGLSFVQTAKSGAPGGPCGPCAPVGPCGPLGPWAWALAPNEPS